MTDKFVITTEQQAVLDEFEPTTVKQTLWELIKADPEAYIKAREYVVIQGNECLIDSVNVSVMDIHNEVHNKARKDSVKIWPKFGNDPYRYPKKWLMTTVKALLYSKSKEIINL